MAADPLSRTTPIRPKFANPPLIERAISVVFEPLQGFSIGDFGLFWATIRSEFPHCEAAPIFQTEPEQFDSFRPAQQQFAIVAAEALPRAFFRNEDRSGLVQVQPDRFGFNWIKTGPDHVYPHSEATFERFFAMLAAFEAFASARGLGRLVFRQCELTNVNAIPVSDVGESFVDLATVLKFPDTGPLPPIVQLENQAIGSKHIILDGKGNAVGRVHTAGQPGVRMPENELVYRLDITARSAPIVDGLEGVRAFLDLSVSAVNAVFLSYATQAGRQFWGEKNGNGF